MSKSITFMTESNRILLRRKNALILYPTKRETQPDNAAYIGAAMTNIQALGFTFGKDTLDVLNKMSKDEVIALYKELVPALSEMVGADKVYSPMYPNFPAQVMNLDDAELFFNAVVHYLTMGEIMPAYEKEPRFPLLCSKEFTEITVANFDTLMEVFTNLLGSKTSLSNQDKEDLAYFIHETPYSSFMPESIPLKENVAYFAALVIRESENPSAACIAPYFKTATDVLRLIAVLSGEDVSLSSSKMRVKKMKRPERRMIMDLLSSCGNLEEDMYRYKGLWITVGEIIHPGEFAKAEKYHKVISAFNNLRSGNKPATFGGKVEKAISEKNVREAVRLLTSRPGEFARRLDELLRLGVDKDVVTFRFDAVAEDVSTPVLWQVREHMASRLRQMADAEDKVRVFFPKGNTAKVFAADDALADIPVDACVSIIKSCDKGLRAQYAKKEPMGKVFIDKELENHIVPFAQRSASSAFKMLTRGSKFHIQDNVKVIRPFIWWTNMENGLRVDIDLSVAFFSDDWKTCVGYVSYTRLRDNKFKCYHSGDITNGDAYGGDGVSEFIDISPEDILKNGARYALVQVYAFTMESFNKLPCSFGWMAREDFDSGEIYEPRTVEQNMALTANARCAVPIIIDCKERNVIWADMAVSERNSWGGNNVESNIRGVAASAYAIANMARPSMYSLVAANAEARGEIVESREEADVIFSNDTTKPLVTVKETDEAGHEVEKQVEKDVKIYTAYDLDYFMGQLL